jgi:hypothetical protein
VSQLVILAFGDNKQSEQQMASADLEFFNCLSGHLDIELSIPAQQVAPRLLNLQSPPDARIVALKLTAEVYDTAKNEFRALTVDELDSIAFRGSEIRLCGESERVVSHNAPNGAFFTVRELLLAIEETERQTRNESEWLGGVDVHHIFFEGIHEDSDGVWQIRWGS